MDSEARNGSSSSGQFGGYRGRYSVLADGSADDEWEKRSKDNKRRKCSSVGTFETFEHDDTNIKESLLSNEQFRELPTDETLVTLFELMSNVSSVSTRLSRTEDKLVSVECAVSRDQSRVKLLE